MTACRVLLILTVLAGLPTTAEAQSWQPLRGEPVVDPHRYQVEQHRHEMDQLRARADQREAVARQLESESRLHRQRLEVMRRPEPDLLTSTGSLRSLEQESARRRSASDRHRVTETGLDQIDDWLDRPRD